jgi:hypothetical protein
MNRIDKKFRLILFVVLSTLACVMPNLTSPAIPTPLPINALGTVIVLTSNAAATQTVISAPTTTPSPTETPFPSNTPSETPTPTQTIIIILDTMTPFRSPTPTAKISTSSYACETLSLSPGEGSILSPGQVFYWIWTVRNTGTETWDAASYDVKFYKGEKLATIKGIDLPNTVSPGETIALVVEMQAPYEKGNYSTTWGIMGKKSVCQITYSIKVK